MISGAAAIARGPPTCGATARSTPTMSCGVAPESSALATCQRYETGSVDRDQRSDLDEREGTGVQAGALLLGRAEFHHLVQHPLVPLGHADQRVPGRIVDISLYGHSHVRGPFTRPRFHVR